jgi:hypothetical protein
LCTLFMPPARILRSAIGLRPSTLLHLHKVLKKRKYRMLFSPPCGRRPGPKGPNQELIDAVVAMKRRNPPLGLPSHCPADLVGIRCRDRQGCGTPYPDRSLPAQIGFSRSILAHFHRSHQGHP